VLFEEIDKYAATKKIVVDERAAAEGAAWLSANEDATALTPERLAALEAAEVAAHGGGDDVLGVLDEAVSPVAGRRFTRT
jgi:(E)-4-hydroxy-3-methylbut-2-enyl-diphosphate synthase